MQSENHYETPEIIMGYVASAFTRGTQRNAEMAHLCHERSPYLAAARDCSAPSRARA
jgi:hypothetical protein